MPRERNRTNSAVSSRKTENRKIKSKISHHELEFIYDRLEELQTIIREKDRLLQFLEEENQELILSNKKVVAVSGQLKKALVLGTKDLEMASKVYDRIASAMKTVAGDLLKLRLENKVLRSQLDPSLPPKRYTETPADLEKESLMRIVQNATSDVFSMKAVLESAAERMQLIQAKNKLSLSKLQQDVKKEWKAEVLRLERENMQLMRKVKQLELELNEVGNTAVLVNVAVMTELPMTDFVEGETVLKRTTATSFDKSVHDKQVQCELLQCADVSPSSEHIRTHVQAADSRLKMAQKLWDIERSSLKQEVAQLLVKKGDESMRSCQELSCVRRELHLKNVELVQLREKSTKLEKQLNRLDNNSCENELTKSLRWNFGKSQEGANRTLDTMVEICSQKERRIEKLLAELQESRSELERTKSESSQKVFGLTEELALLRQENRTLRQQLRSNQLFELSVVPPASSCVLHQKQIEALENRLHECRDQLEKVMLQEAEAKSEREVMAQETEDIRQRYESQLQELVRRKSTYEDIENKRRDLENQLKEAKAAIKLLQALVRRMSKRKESEIPEEKPSEDRMVSEMSNQSSSESKIMERLKMENGNLNELLEQRDLLLIDREKVIEVLSREKNSLAQEVIRLRDNLAKLRALRILNTEFECDGSGTETKDTFKQNTTDQWKQRKRLENSLNEAKKKLSQAETEVVSMRNTNQLLSSAVARLEREKLVLEDEVSKRKFTSALHLKQSKVKFLEKLDSADD